LRRNSASITGCRNDGDVVAEWHGFELMTLFASSKSHNEGGNILDYNNKALGPNLPRYVYMSAYSWLWEQDLLKYQHCKKLYKVIKIL